MSARLAEIQECQLKILKEVTEICEANNIDYYLAFGTFLGAIRHEGFIPWDDDIDIYIKNEDVKKFKRACQKLPPYYFLQDKKTDHGVPWIFMKVRDTRTYMPDTERNIQQGIWIDVFPLMYSAGTERKKKRQFCYLYRYQNIVASQEKINISLKNLLTKRAIREIYYSIMSSVYYQLASMLQDKYSGQRITLEIEFFNKFSDKEYDRTRNRVMIADAFLKHPRKYKFEDTEFYGFEDYDKYLSDYYGEYMVPVRSSHFNNYDFVKIDI